MIGEGNWDQPALDLDDTAESPPATTSSREPGSATHAERTVESLESHFKGSLMLMSLQLAVPLRIAELLDLDDEDRELKIEAWRRAALQPITERGDLLMYGAASSRSERGQPAQVFNHLARGLASLAFHPGGVTFCGRHWCAREHHHDVAGADDLSCWATAVAEADAEAPTPQRQVVDVVDDL
jgi:hypothetical protein